MAGYDLSSDVGCAGHQTTYQLQDVTPIFLLDNGSHIFENTYKFTFVKATLIVTEQEAI